MIITAFFLVLPVIVCSQEKVKVVMSEFRTENKEGLSEAWKSIKAGDKLFKAGKGTYKEAREKYLLAYQYNGENAELNYKIGICYLFTDDKFESIEYLRKAFLLKNDVAGDIRYMLARAYQMTLDFDRALEEYSEYKKVLHPKKLALIKDEIDRKMEECENGKALVAEPLRVIISNMGDSINSEADDYYSLFASSDTVMYFTSRRQHDKKAKRSAYDNKYFEDIYFSTLRGEDWGKAMNMGKKINKKNKNSAAVGLSADGNQLYIYRGDKDGGDLYVSKFKNGKWTSPKSLSSKFNTKYRETSMCMGTDKRSLYFVSSNTKDTYGGRDIYVSKMNALSKWQKPENLGNEINTSYDEEAIHISPDGKALYFSSKGHNSMGGYDVFRCDLNDLGEWSDPVNVGYPINTPDDDVFYSVDKNGKYAYYSTIRMGGLGGKDIFRIVFLGAEKEMVMSTEDILIAGTLDSVKNGFFQPPVDLSIDTSFIVVGKVYDINSDDGIISKLEFIDVDRSQVVATSLSNDTGAYRASLPEGKAYGIEITARDYMFYLDIVDISGESTEEEIVRDFGLEKVEVGATVVLENIFFETAKATLKSESFAQLEQVLKFMESNPTLRMEISGHTDNTGSLKVNTKLSQARAEAVVDWLVEHGIDASRLDAMGYAFSQPIAPNDTPEGRAKNRRVEFKILSM